jgi:hypothetical protein
VLRLAPSWVSEGLSTRGLDPGEYPWRGHRNRLVTLVASGLEKVRTEEVGLADLIFSYNALEHLQDLHTAVFRMAKQLKDDGKVVHRIDYGPHDIWSRAEDPLTFLRFSDSVWSLMGSHRGYPNRVRHAELVEAFRNAGFDVTARITKSFSAEFFDANRARMPARFSGLGAAACCVADAEIVGSKRAGCAEEGCHTSLT